MWAGGQLQWFQDNPVVVGNAIQRISHLKSVTHKAGYSGDLLFGL